MVQPLVKVDLLIIIINHRLVATKIHKLLSTSVYEDAEEWKMNFYRRVVFLCYQTALQSYTRSFFSTIILVI